MQPVLRRQLKSLIILRKNSSVKTDPYTMTRPVQIGKVVSKDSCEISQAVSILGNEGVIAVPTDTVYGIACLSQSDVAIKRLYSIKKRDHIKPVAICVGEIDHIYKWGKVTIGRDLLESLLPGAVTLIFERTDDLNKHLNPDTNLVGIRIPDSPFIRTLCQEFPGSSLALTSANLSSQTSTLCVNEFSHLWPLFDLVIDSGMLCQGEESVQRLGSTVVDLSEKGYFKVVRDGCCLKTTRSKLLEWGLRDVT